MNDNRIIPEGYSKSVTIIPDWLVGFIEGDGSFSASSGVSLVISLHNRDKYLLEAIQDYFKEEIITSYINNKGRSKFP